MSLTIEARKSFRTVITGVISTAAVQAYIGPITLGTAVANFATAEAPNVAAGDSTVPLLSTLVTSVGLAFVLNG